MKFQSQLEAGEQLILSLFQGNNLLYNESTTLLDRALGYQWQTNLEAGTYQIKYQVKKNGVNSALVSIPSFTINNPAPIQVSNIQTKGVSCFQGSDGHIEMTITGEPGRSFAYYVEREANGVYSKYRDTTAFRNTKRIENLEKGKYRFIVKDTGNCFAKETDGQTNTVFEAIIATPEHELRLDYPVQAQILPSFHGATNGALKAVIIGGTPKADGTYNFVWKNSLGENMSSNITTKVFGDRFEIDLKNIGSDTYTLTVTDANFNATNSMQQHCTVSNSAYFLNQPNPLTLALTENNPISCNNTNDKLNPFSDGVLKAHADGGVKLKPSQNAGLSYYYTWKKWVNGVWKILPQYTSNIAADLDVGRYAVNIEDANGIVIGVYVNNLLSEAKDVIYDLKQPDLLEVSLRSTPMSCNYNKDGSVIATVTGGTGKYTYNWSNGATSPTISHLSSGTYFVYVKDEKGCEASASIQVSKPNEIVVSTLKKLPPTCYNGTDGEIEIGVAGGNPPYQIKWKNGNTDKKRTQLTAGIYQVEVSDSKGCLEIVEIELVDPDPILVSLGEDRTLCSDQSLQFDVSIADAAAQYKWTSDTGFSSESAKITIKESGNYTVTVTTSQGCKATDSIQVSSKSTEIDAQFLLSSQAFAKEEILIVNTSVPVGDKTDWTYPVQAELIEKTDRYLQLKFDEPGAYEVALRAYQGDCYLDYKKTIIVEKARTLYGLGDPELPFIKDFRVYPNPSSGAFKAHIQLSEPAFISLRLFSMLSNIPINDQSPSSDSVYTIEYNENMPAGLYFLLLETPKGNQIRKVVIE
ncbi:MAG: T9SS type A sorting domain-containing protein [Flavobacteriaceae bacterium]|nr:T9SS type A sorting domain-containing protein [Flavobacteriaceae bacterium]